MHKSDASQTRAFQLIFSPHLYQLAVDRINHLRRAGGHGR